MKIEVKRLYKKANYTIGKIYVDGQYVSDTLEDTDRGLTQEMTDGEIEKKKVFGKTAIPSGEYDVTLSVISPKFGKMPYYKEVCGGRLPRLLSVLRVLRSPHPCRLDSRQYRGLHPCRLQ